jgi:tRNA(adenine34) deaminase
MFDDYAYLSVCLNLARKAAALGEVPVGAIVVYENQIIGRGFNLRENRQDPLLHAEMIAIEQASRFLKSWRLNETTLYVTLEPCIMCAGAILNSRIKRVVYAAIDNKAGAVASLYQLLSDPRLNHQVQCNQGPLAEQATSLLQSFFQARRIQSNKQQRRAKAKAMKAFK